MFFKDKKRDNVITCPFCGREYLPSEIFIPKNFFGKPEDIDRSVTGEIEVFSGSTMDTTEDYVCDGCGKQFVVESEIKFRAVPKEENKFDTVYTSHLYSNKISLFEDLGGENDTNT